MVKLRDGQRSNSICHSASVSSCASSTTMCANGSGEQVGIGLGQRAFVDQGIADPLLSELGHHAFVVVGLQDLVDDPVHPLTLGGDGRFMTTLAA